LAGELQKIYDELVVSHKKISKSGRRTWQKYNIAAENFFAPRTESVNMSDLFQTMQGEGFTFDSIAEMLDAVEDAMFYGKESYATHGGLATNQIAAGYRQSFSLSRDPSNPPNPSDSFSLSRVTPAELSQSLIDKIGEDALRLEQPKISYEDKNQLLLDFSASVIANADGRAASTNAGDIQEEGLLLGRRSGLGEISILAQKHLEEIKENLKVDFIGATIDSAKALAIHAQSLRNPKYETFYLLAAQLRNKRHKGGAGFKIVDVMAVTSRVPCSAKVFTDGKDADAGYQSHIDFLRGAKATHYFMLHNHPSGDVSPSSIDLRLTIQHAQRLANVGIQLVDHIVINHKNYATIDAYGVENQYSIPASALKDAIDPYAWPSPAIAPGIGMMTNGPLEIINAHYSRSFNS
jgi:hypothetical protein